MASQPFPLIPYDLDLDALAPIEILHAPKFTKLLGWLAGKGYCVWFRAKGWVKIRSSVIGSDVWAYELDGEKIRFLPNGKSFPLRKFFPTRRVVLEGYIVFIPNNPRTGSSELG